jgi:hypothetical protein
MVIKAGVREDTEEAGVQTTSRLLVEVKIRTVRIKYVLFAKNEILDVLTLPRRIFIKLLGP